MVIDMNRIELIKKLYEQEGWSVTELSRRFGHDRKTIRKYINGADVKYDRKERYDSPLRSEIESRITAWYEDDLKGPRKQRRTAKRMYDQLRSEYGYTGGYTTVKTILREIRGINREVFVPRDHQAGDYCEFDFGYATIKLKGEKTKVALHCFQLTYSNDIFVYCSLRETQEEMFESHKRAFEHFGGVPKYMRYDNLTQAVKTVLKGQNREEQLGFCTFKDQYGFNAEFCAPAKGWQKGDVEGCVGYSRRNYFSPIPSVSNMEDLNEGVRKWCLSLRDSRKVYGTDKKVGCLLLEERVEFLELRDSLPESGKHQIGTVNHYSLVSVESVFYSVPSEYAYSKVDVLITAKEVIISSKEKEIARHKRSFEKGRQIFNPIHYLPVFIKKPYAVINSKPIRELPVSFQTFFKRAYSKGYATVTDCIQVLSLLKEYSIEEIEVALDLAMSYQTYYFEGIKNILLQLKSGTTAYERMTVSQTNNKKLFVRIPDVDLKRYDRLSSGDLS